jgi:hypothetical protein
MKNEDGADLEGAVVTQDDDASRRWLRLHHRTGMRTRRRKWTNHPRQLRQRRRRINKIKYLNFRLHSSLHTNGMEDKAPSPKTWQDEKVNWEPNQTPAAKPLPTVAPSSGGQPPNNYTIVEKWRKRQQLHNRRKVARAPLEEVIIDERGGGG